MPRPKSATEQLAALVLATGVVCITTAAAEAANGSLQTNAGQTTGALKAIDRTPYRLVHGAGKASGCGKCGANACGMSYWDKTHSKQHQQKRVRKHSSTKQNGKRTMKR